MENEIKCSECGGTVKYYDKVKRFIKEEGGKKQKIIIERYKCQKCHTIHRAIPNELYFHKHYAARIIDGVISGHITSDMLEYEDYPCDMTMKRWTQM